MEVNGAVAEAAAAVWWPLTAVTTPCVLAQTSGAFAAAISCASLALANANVELFDLVASCSVVRRRGVLLIELVILLSTMTDGCVAWYLLAPRCHKTARWPWTQHMPSMQLQMPLQPWH